MHYEFFILRSNRVIYLWSFLTLELPLELPVKLTGSAILQMCQPSFRDHGPRWINNTRNRLHNMEFLL